MEPLTPNEITDIELRNKGNMDVERLLQLLDEKGDCSACDFLCVYAAGCHDFSPKYVP